MQTAFVVALGIVVMAGCETSKDIVAPWDMAGSESKLAHLRIIHASPNFRIVTGQADSIHVFANGVKMNGVRMSYGGAAPATNPASYVTLPAGMVDLKVSVGGFTTLDSIPITTLKIDMKAGEFYSFIITDSLLNASKDSSRILVRDSFPTPNTGSIGLRFVQALADTAADKRIDVYSARRNNNIYTNVLPGTVTSFSNQPFINFSDTLIIRRSGTTTELARINNVIFTNTRVYTLFLRGNAGVATGSKSRSLTFYVNR